MVIQKNLHFYINLIHNLTDGFLVSYSMYDFINKVFNTNKILITVIFTLYVYYCYRCGIWITLNRTYTLNAYKYLCKIC